jgi:hypothetical protein
MRRTGLSLAVQRGKGGERPHEDTYVEEGKGEGEPVDHFAGLSGLCRCGFELFGRRMFVVCEI